MEDHIHVCYIKRLDSDPRHFAASAVGYKGKFWTNGQELTWSIKNPTPAQIGFITNACKEWAKYANINFRYIDDWSKAVIRITTVSNDGSWSYLGTDALRIPPNEATLNLGWINRDIATDDYSTVLHEIGHALGLGHEMGNIHNGTAFQWNREAVIKDLSGPPNYWSIAQIENNVFKQIPIDESDGTSLDMYSIMMYHFPAHWTLDGKGTPHNTKLSDLDKKFIGLIYAKPEEPEEPAPVMVDLRQFLKFFYQNYWIGQLTKGQILIALSYLGVIENPGKTTEELLITFKKAIGYVERKLQPK